ncbi:nitroreductase family deazaflavin-dependent oxidoreductase [Streptomyces sp. PRKS01-65]|nr:nitroreductase/quinone reductase family protein [Streptomyces harenosi]NEY35892.1 nitroreductase family deazaflavin-dependent oxidoreductase [Streptomyces harenosi]
MPRLAGLRFRAATALQRRLAGPLPRRLPLRTAPETTGRVRGLPRRTPVGGRRAGDSPWLVAECGGRAQYVRDIRADPRVRVRIGGRRHPGTARPLPDGDPVARERTLPRCDSAAVGLFGTELMTVRVAPGR